jgi:hypothetical protein
MLTHFVVETSPATTGALSEAGSAEGVGQGKAAAEGTEVGWRYFVQIALLHPAKCYCNQHSSNTEKADFLQVLVTICAMLL